MQKPLKIIITLPAILFAFMGLRWMVNPEAAAVGQFMPLLDGTGLSSQIADLGALFLGMGTMILLGLITQNKTWLQAPIILLLMVAFMRVTAWLFHDATLMVPMIVVELVVAALLNHASKKLEA